MPARPGVGGGRSRDPVSGASSSTSRLNPARRRTLRRLPGWIGWLALLAFGLRALVPLGFEPGGHSLSIVLCHEGFPAGFFAHGPLGHGSHRSSGAGSSHCLFCNGTTPAPAYAFAGLVHHAAYAVASTPLEPASLSIPRLAHTPQARAPPTDV